MKIRYGHNRQSIIPDYSVGGPDWRLLSGQTTSSHLGKGPSSGRDGLMNHDLLPNQGAAISAPADD